MANSDLVHEYCDAVERDSQAHPIQATADLMVPREFVTAADLYGYTVSPLDLQCRALLPSAPVRDAAFLLFDNVYYRKSGGRAPHNADRERARKAGFKSSFKGHDRGRADELARNAIRLWGPPAGGNAAAGIAPAAAPQPGAIGRQFDRARLDEAPSTGPRSSSPEFSAPPASTPMTTTEVIGRTRALWESLRGMYPSWQSGYAVFYSPVPEHPRVVIIGANPGGGPSAFDEQRAGRIPMEHDYFTFDYALARKMRELFAAAGNVDALRSSVKLNLNFFRSRDAAELAMAPDQARRRMSEHSERCVAGLLAAWRPQLVLAEGMATFDRLSALLDAGATGTAVTASGRRAYCRASLAGGLLVGLIHPTGAQVARSDWERIAAELRKDLERVAR